MKSNNTIFVRLGIFFLAFVLFVTVALLWWRDAMGPIDLVDEEPIIFVVQKGDGVKAIATKLSQQRLIRSSTGFYLLVKFLGIERELQAGDFRLNRSMDASTIAKELTHGIVDVWVTTLEGWRVEEVANKLAKELDIPESEFLKYAREGYMFPDTYLIPRDATAAAIADIFLQNFETKVSSQWKIDSTKSGLSFDEVITLASIVEREGRSDQDRPIIAGILLKRLNADWPLQADATLQYALGYQSFEKAWWKKALTNDDKLITSPYNTYARTGLPKGPISNPGISSIRAVVYPQDSEYWYYIHDEDGVAHFATTLEEHESNINLYLR